MPRMLAPWIRCIPEAEPPLPLPLLGLHPVGWVKTPKAPVLVALVPCPSWRDSLDSGSSGATRERARGAEALNGDEDEGELDDPVAGGVVVLPAIVAAAPPLPLPWWLAAMDETTLLARALLQSNKGAPAATSVPLFAT